MYCDLQLTRDNLGVCVSNVNIDFSTTAAMAYPKGEKTFNVNGQDLRGWYALDYNLEDLKNTTFYVQGVVSRPTAFDGMFPVFAPDDIAGLNATRMWLNVENDMFYNDHKLSAAKYIQDSAQYWVASHISSPEIGFLKFMSGQVDKTKTKLIFKFHLKDEIEPTNREKYGAILNNLASIKPFAAGILVPKEYIFPLTPEQYSDPPTTLVSDAHKQGFEVYAYGFASDVMTSYNYSYDPVQEYLQFIDNGHFSVDGIVTDFPSTASNAVACFAQSKNLTTKVVKGLVISHNGASGDYPGCSDLAYHKAIADGADIIDCTVQMSKDKVAFCLANIDLSAITTALTTYMDRSATVHEIQAQNGIFAFDLDWSEIEALKPTIEIPWKDSGLVRNPKNKNKGKFVTLASFLDLAKANKTGGVLINIQNAAFLASKKGIGVVDAVTKALTNASFDKPSEQKVLIQSDDSSVLAAFKDKPNYQRVLTIKDTKSDAPKSVVDEIKKNADGVVVDRETVVQQNSGFFTTAFTKVVEEMHASNISVYVAPLRNEFVFLNFDYLSDPYLQLATYFSSQMLDGVITDFPATAVAYMRNPCSDVNNPNIVLPVRPIEAGDLAKQIDPVALPPALPPKPALESSDVNDPPLPPVAKIDHAKAPSPGGDENSGASRNVDIWYMIISNVVFALLPLY
ncbi:Glycerophosphodiester phosphodiesterase [Heracleum sosnowskyi]|uniref:glycerophosphodiester phosphodiesterase n=1 Tax=Heracleum sosnowskyi TaxID=360622 RepID=A0AAD8J1C5_9APIA|nr:Glycerophosphodiester phosphodiesterase [Heracleum sosnowskyi]